MAPVDFRSMKPPSMSDYDQVATYSPIAQLMKARYDIRVRRWRKSMSGCAWRVDFSNGKCIRWIEAPQPRTLLSLSIFLHEVGHHVIGFDTYKRRCEEELAAWQWALAQMRTLDLMPDAKVLRRFELSMQYAVGKAQRRGIKTLPASLEAFAA